MRPDPKVQSTIPVDPFVVEKLKNIVRSGGSVMDVVRAVRQAHHPEVDSLLYPIMYLRKVFGVSIHDAMHVCSYEGFTDGTLTEAQIDAILLPMVRAAIE